MKRGLLVILGWLFAASAAQAQTPAAAPADPTYYAVSYAEAAAASSARMVAEFKKYAEASRRQDGFVRFEIFEQVGRAGHFALIETWRDQKAFDARDASAAKQLADGLAPVRLANYDQRPYKTMTLGPRKTVDRQTVYVISHVDVSANPQVPVLLQRVTEASRGEAGNLRYDVMQHTMRANHFTVIEAYRDDKALEAHAAAAHTKLYREELGPFLGSPLDERIFKAVE